MVSFNYDENLFMETEQIIRNSLCWCSCRGPEEETANRKICKLFNLLWSLLSFWIMHVRNRMRRRDGPRNEILVSHKGEIFSARWKSGKLENLNTNFSTASSSSFYLALFSAPHRFAQCPLKSFSPTNGEFYFNLFPDAVEKEARSIRQIFDFVFKQHICSLIFHVCNIL